MSQKIVIIGCGIAGPVLAIFLKLKGYSPIIYDRLRNDTEAGVGFLLQTNGLRVLSLIPGLFESLPGMTLEELKFYSVVPGDVTDLGKSDIPAYLLKKYGLGMVGVERAKFHRLLIETAQGYGIEVKWGHQLVSLEQSEDKVSLKFQNGHTDTGSFAIGCDGLHSNTRAALFGREKADFTGLIQTGGITPTPDLETVFGTPAMINIFGVDSHFITYPISATHSSWAITQHQAEFGETWGLLDDEAKEGIKTGPFSHWEFGAGLLIKNAERIVKYGLYDRPALKTWYKSRVMLLGDAAHPTSPHLGQGANQAFEDIYHLVRVLVKHNPHARFPSTELLGTIFAEYESIRLPRSADLVLGARKAGEIRVIPGVDECKARNIIIKDLWTNKEERIKGFEHMLGGPFIGQSEI